MFDWVLSTLLFMKKIAGKKKLNLFTWATSARKFKYFLFRLCLKWSIIMQLVMTFRILVLMTLKWWTCRVMKVRVWLVEILLIASVRSSHRRCSVRKVVLRNFAKFTGKHLCQSLFNKVAGPSFNFIAKHLLSRTPLSASSDSAFKTPGVH